MAILYYETELYHHGVKGQKWGVRRQKSSHSRGDIHEARYHIKNAREQESYSKNAYRLAPNNKNYNAWVNSAKNRISIERKYQDVADLKTTSEKCQNLIAVGAPIVAGLTMLGLSAIPTKRR